MTHITTKSNDKIDIVSVGLKGLLIFTFLFIYLWLITIWKQGFDRGVYNSQLHIAYSGSDSMAVDNQIR